MVNMPTKNEDRFISYMREPLAREDGSLVMSSCDQSFIQVAQRLRLVAVNAWYLTPRGVDLIATADAIGYDPNDKPQPEPEPEARVQCVDCDGLGRVSIGKLGRERTIVDLVEGEPAAVIVLPGWDIGCTACGGAGDVPLNTTDIAAYVKPMGDAIAAAATNLAGAASGIADAMVRLSELFKIPLRALESGSATTAATKSEKQWLGRETGNQLRFSRSGRIVFNFGKHDGKRVDRRPRYVAWMHTASFTVGTLRVAQACVDAAEREAEAGAEQHEVASERETLDASGHLRLGPNRCDLEFASGPYVGRYVSGCLEHLQSRKWPTDTLAVLYARGYSMPDAPGWDNRALTA